MMKRELYMSRIRPFIGGELIKVMTGIRRSGKSVMLKLIQQELLDAGADRTQFISFNFENMSYGHLCNAQALHDEVIRRAESIEGKVYLFFDEIREAVFGGNMRDINLMLENIVFMELLRRGYTVTVGKAGEKEIDFVCEKRSQKLYVQVCYLLASEDTMQREFGVYHSIRDNYPKYVVSLDEFDFSRDGIQHRNIRDFLMMPAWT